MQEIKITNIKQNTKCNKIKIVTVLGFDPGPI